MANINMRRNSGQSMWRGTGETRAKTIGHFLLNSKWPALHLRIAIRTAEAVAIQSRAASESC